jgi:YggT family protein
MCEAVGFFLLVLRLAILGRVLYTWVDPSPDPTPDPTNRLKSVLWGLTEPILTPLRRYIPPVGMFDFTPVIALVLLYLAGEIATVLFCSA